MVSILLIVVVLAVWIFFGVNAVWSARKEAGNSKWLNVVAGILVVAGAAGFFGAALSSEGGLNWLPSSFEWPVGNASGVVTTKDHLFVVPHSPSGRIQIYDSNWKFVRGWPVHAGGGAFLLRISESNHVEVFTARGNWHYTFDHNGKLLSQENYPAGSYSSFSQEGQSYFVPTAPWLLVFSNPGYSWLSAMAGLGLFVATGKKKKRPSLSS